MGVSQHPFPIQTPINTRFKKQCSGELMFEFDEFFKRMRRMFKEFDRDFERGLREADFSKFSRMPGVMGFRIEIKDTGTGKPDVRVTRIGERPAGVVPVAEEVPIERPPKVRWPERKPITQMLETNVGKIERLDEVVLTMQTPGVDEKDVETRQLGNVLEIVARKPTGEAYFGTFELPPDAVPSGRTIKLKNGFLVVKVPKRRLPRA